MARPIDLLEYELHDNLDALKNSITWMYILAFIALYTAITNNTKATVACIIIIFLIEMYRDYKSGRVDAYIKKKKGIPTAGEIRRMKEKYQQENGPQR